MKSHFNFRLAVTMLLLTNLTYLNAQHRYSTCYFGTVGIDFRHSPPVVINNSGMNGKESPASICDENGEILFYSNGGNSPLNPGVTGGVWNRNNTLMDNGLLGDSSGCISSYNGAVALKAPSNNKSNSGHLYYLFTKDCIESSFSNPGYNSGLTYALIDMNENGGLGKVISKNNIVVPYSIGQSHSTAYEPVAAIQHANNKDYWIFSYTNDSIYSVLLTENGVGNYRSYDLARGKIVISPARDKLMAGKKLYNFDSETGNLLFIDSLFSGSYAFSPNGKKLYVSTQLTSPYQAVLYQYDLEVSDVQNSYQLIANISQSHALFLAPDHQIYLFLSDANRFAGRIRCPNLTNCDFSMTPLHFNSPNLSTGNVATNIPANFLFWESASCTASIFENKTTNNEITLYPNPNNGSFTVQFPAEQVSGLITITNLSGKSVTSYPVTAEKLEIQEPGLSSGVYFVTWVKEGRTLQTSKLIVH